jgi:hypothetical protein
MLMLVFAIASMFAGVFTVNFGSGKSKAVGAILITVGILVFILFLWGAGVLKNGIVPNIIDFGGIVTKGIVAIAGATLGVLIALGIFLLTIIKT